MTGCVGRSHAPNLKEEEITLNIGYFSEDHFESRYSYMLAIEFPKLKYNIVPTGEFIKKKKTISQWAEEHSFDLIYISSDDMDDFIENNLIQELDNYIKNDSYSLDYFIPSIIDLTKQYGNGKIYGLPPNFHSEALVFNKEVFDQNKVEYPTDKMTWEEVIILASRFEKGLTLPYSSAASWIVGIGQTLDLQAYDDNISVDIINSPSWIKLLQLVREPLKSRSITIDYINNNNNNEFLLGEYAMQVVSHEELKILEQQAKFDWGLVTMPVNPSDSELSHSLKIDGFFAISNHTTKADEAWKLIQFLMSEKVAEMDYRSLYGFSSRTSYVSLSQRENNIEAFYRLNGKPSRNVSPAITEHIERIWTRMMNENIEVEEILKNEAIIIEDKQH